MRHSTIWFLLILLIAPLTGPAQDSWLHPKSVEEALIAADSNRVELEKVLNHYIATSDPQKLIAAYFLVENMTGHGYATYGLYDSTKTEIELDVLAYPDFNTLLTELDSLEAQIGTLDFDRKDFFRDLETITSGALIANIDLAFQAWQEKPWAKHLTFYEFCNYVLPYRGSNEPLEEWRSHFLEKYSHLPDQMTDPADPVEAAASINNDIKSWFRFDERYYCHPTDQGLQEMLDTKRGRCEDMTNLAIFAMRANGLAVTSDYTPYWADTGNNHAWNGLVNKDGKVVMFMGCESNPGDYQLNHRLAKVYRKMYGEQPNNLAFIKPEWEKIPGWLAGKSYLDVTADYTAVSDVTVLLSEEQPDSVNFAYLAVFNSGEWSAIHWGAIDSTTVTFTEMGVNIAYLPMYYRHEELLPAGQAFILTQTGEIRPLVANDDAPQTVTVRATTKRTLDVATDGIEQTFLEPNHEYELFYWQHKWVSLGTQVAADQPLVFDDVPSGGLYWLMAKDSRKDERIFTYENGEQVWW